MAIVGPVRLRTVHSVLRKGPEGDVANGCALAGALDECYESDLGVEEFIRTDPIAEPFNATETPDAEPVVTDWQPCEQTNSTYAVAGENSVFPCGGYILEVWPSNATAADFQYEVETHLDMLFAASARGLNIDMTLYLPRADWWVHCQILYEYGI